MGCQHFLLFALVISVIGYRCFQLQSINTFRKYNRGNFNIINQNIKHRDSLRTIGGHVVDITEIPYQVGLFVVIRYSPLETGSCGGALISHHHVLTSAHCCQKNGRIVQSMIVILGANYLTTEGERREAIYVFPHPLYNEISLQNDIGLVKIGLVVFNNFIRPISLPSQGQRSYVGRKVIVSGYGKIADVDYIFERRLRAVTLTIISNQLCKKYMDKPFDVIQIRNENICSAASSNGICDGDSGGPMAIKFEGIHELIGLTSYSAQQCEAQLPSVFIKVEPYLEWIKSITMRSIKMRSHRHRLIPFNMSLIPLINETIKFKKFKSYG